VKASSLTLQALSLSTFVALLAGCAGSLQQGDAPGVMPQSRAIPAYAGGRKSWMLPNAKNSDLLYLSGSVSNDVFVYTYPRFKLVGTLTGFNGPAYPCPDRNGDVWIPNFYAANIVEYPHGGANPIATLSVPNLSPQNCSVDPTTGNLAVVGYGLQSSTSGSIAVYIGAKGTAKIIPVSFAATSFCSYDASGNLFVDGFGYSEEPPFVFGVVPKGRKSFKAITLDTPPYQPFNVQWDGKDVAVGDAASIDRFAIHGTKAVEVNSLHLNVIHMIGGFWIQASKVSVTNLFGQGSYPEALLYAYPHGGNPIETISGTDYESGLTVSLARK
jgi:hypothetical protein